MCSNKGSNNMFASDKLDPIHNFVRAVLAEFIGTAFLIFLACGTCVTTSDVVATALAFGLSVTCLVAAFGHISGAHINPAVTVGLLASGGVGPIRGVIYIISQLLGGLSGAGLLALVLGKKAKKVYDVCANSLWNKDTDVRSTEVYEAIVVEILLAFLLVFVVCSVCETNSPLTPLIIGLTVAVCHLFAIKKTSCGLNPARTFGPAIVENHWKDHWVFWLGPIIGGLIAGISHRLIFSAKSQFIPAGPQRDPKDTSV